jgi:hypothetical protein
MVKTHPGFAAFEQEVQKLLAEVDMLFGIKI